MSNHQHQIFYPVPNSKDSRTTLSMEYLNSLTPQMGMFDQRRMPINQSQYYNTQAQSQTKFKNYITIDDQLFILGQNNFIMSQQKNLQPLNWEHSLSNNNREITNQQNQNLNIYQTNSISPQPQKLFQTNYQQQQQNFQIPFYENSQSAPPQAFSNDSSFDLSQYGMFPKDKELDKVVFYIIQLRDPEKREVALAELSKKRESFNNLAPLMWTSIGTIAIFLQEIAQIYTCLSPPNLNTAQSTRICNVLGLLQCLALHQQTRSFFLKAHLPLFLYPFLNTSNKSKAFENLRVTSLGVIGALVKGDDTDAINFLMQTEIIPLCLRIMKKGQELSRTVATFIVQKILLDDNGLRYICETPERFFAVSTVLQNMIDDLLQNGKDDQRLLRHIIRCYLRLSENNKAGEVLKKYLPEILKDTSQQYIKDEVVKKWHITLLKNLSIVPTDI